LLRIGDGLQYLRAADAVDHAVMDLGDEGAPPMRQALDEDHLPRRPIQRQWNRKHVVDDAGERGLVSRGWQDPLVNVTARIEMRIGLPRRETPVEARTNRKLTIAGEPGQPLADGAYEIVEGRGAVQHRDAADV